MTAWPEQARGPAAFLAAVAARAERWLLEPASPRPRAVEPEPDLRPVVAVIGLASRCGTTTIARALAIELAKRDRAGAAIVSAATRGPAPALATAPARRLARAFPPEAALAAGRLCLVEPEQPALHELARSRPAPLVLDVGHGCPPESPRALADAVVLVATPDVEPALAEVVAMSLTRDARPPVLLLNRAVELGAWRDRGTLHAGDAHPGVRLAPGGCDTLTVGEARLGARLALAGRDPTPSLARPIAELADLVVGEGSP